MGRSNTACAWVMGRCCWRTKIMQNPRVWCEGTYVKGRACELSGDASMSVSENEASVHYASVCCCRVRCIIAYPILCYINHVHIFFSQLVRPSHETRTSQQYTRSATLHLREGVGSTLANDWVGDDSHQLFNFLRGCS